MTGINVTIGAEKNESDVTFAEAKGDKGDPGIQGKSAYEVWLELGNIGTEADFIASLRGPKGDTVQVEMVWAID